MATKKEQTTEAVAVDVVQVASRLADGTPDQTAGFEYLHPEEAAEYTASQLGIQAVSNLDAAESRARRAEGAEGSADLDPQAAERKAAHEAAFAAGQTQAAAETGTPTSTKKSS